MRFLTFPVVMRDEHVAQFFDHAMRLGAKSFLRYSLFAPTYASLQLSGDRLNGGATPSVTTLHDDHISGTRLVEHNARLAITRVPSDVWIRIFENHLVANSKSMGELQNQLLALSTVCRAIRHIFLSTPRLWTLFTVDLSRYSTLFFERCGTAPLRILFNASHGSDQSRVDNWNNVARHLYHTKSLALSLARRLSQTPDPDQLIKLFQQPAPLLHKLTLISHGWGNAPRIDLGQALQRLRVLDLQNFGLDQTGTYPALGNITHLQYTEPGVISPTHLVWLLGQLKKIERLGLASSRYRWCEGFVDGLSPLDPPKTLHQVVLSETNDWTLKNKNILRFFSRVPRVDIRPATDSTDQFLVDPWSSLKRVNIRCRRAVLEYHMCDALDTKPRVLNFFAHRKQVINALSNASAHSLTTLLLDEGAWDFLAAESTWTKEYPILLPALDTLRVTMGGCIYAATRGTRSPDAVGIFAQPGILAALDMPNLNTLDLVLLSSWTCSRVNSGRGTGKQLSQPCVCHNNGIVSMSQVVDLLHHLRGVAQRRLSRLAIFGVTQILDDEPRRSARSLKQLVARFELHVQVPERYAEEDAELNAFDGLVVRPRPDDKDFRYRF